MFKKLSLVNKGAYGSVYLCEYRNMLKIVKIVQFDTNDLLLVKSIIRESFLLKNNKNPYVMSTNIMFIKNTHNHNIKNIHYIMDIYSHNLGIQMENWKDDGCNIEQLRKVITQIMYGINYLHENNIIHRDIKPENILIDSELNIKITDFGISKLDYQGTDPNKLITNTDYVQTLWYRSPEVLLLKCCDKKSDMWSIGCILFELLTYRQHVLFSYKTAREVIFAMFKYFKITNPSLNILKIYELENEDFSLNEKNDYNLYHRLTKYAFIKDDNYIDLMKHLLMYHPEERYSASDCLKHDFLKDSNIINSCKKIEISNDIKFIDNYTFCESENKDITHKKYLSNILKKILHSH